MIWDFFPVANPFQNLVGCLLEQHDCVFDCLAWFNAYLLLFKSL